MLNFYTTYTKQSIVWEMLGEGKNKILALLVFIYLINIYLSHPKFICIFHQILKPYINLKFYF
jgi:hypothetical protein